MLYVHEPTNGRRCTWLAEQVYSEGRERFLSATRPYQPRFDTTSSRDRALAARSGDLAARGGGLAARGEALTDWAHAPPSLVALSLRMRVMLHHSLARHIISYEEHLYLCARQAEFSVIARAPTLPRPCLPGI